MNAVIYAAKSTADERGSIDTQLANCRALAAELGLEVDSEHQDANASAYHGDRGPGLKAAMAACERIAPCVLIVQHSSRLARGDAIEAQHLAEIALWALKHGVEIESVEQRGAFRHDPLLMAAIHGKQDHEYSKRLAASVRNGMRRSFERGQWHGRPPDGYKIVHDTNDDGAPTARRLVVDPELEPTMARLFGLALDGAVPARIARRLNAEGLRNGRGALWRARDVKRILRNPLYAGIMEYNGARREGEHPRYVTPEQHAWLRERLPLDHAAPRGRPATTHVLAKLAVCERCGSRMPAVTRSRVRADGTKQRTYVCVGKEAGVCDMPPVDADFIDAAVTRLVPRLLQRFDTWLADIHAVAAGARTERQGRLDDALAKVDATDRLIVKAQSAYEAALADDNPQGMRMAERADASAQLRREAALREVEAARCALNELTDHALADQALDLINVLQQPTPQDLNEALRGEFEVFRIAVGDDFWDVDITPVIGAGAAHRSVWALEALSEQDWLNASANRQYSHP